MAATVAAPQQGDDGWGGTTTTEAKEDGKGHSPMRQRAVDIANVIIKALVELIDEGGHGLVLPLTMMVSIRSEYTHQSVVLVEHLAVVLWARLRHTTAKVLRSLQCCNLA